MSDIVNISIEVQNQPSITISTVGTQGPVGDGVTAADLLAATQVIPAADYGFSSAASGSTNSASLQSAIDAANTAGGGNVMLPFGTFNLGVVGSTFRRPGSNFDCKVCVTLKNNVRIFGQGSGRTIVKIANTQSTNAARANMFYAPNAVQNFALESMSLQGNTANQSGYTAGYTQGDDGGTLLAFGGSSGGNTNVYLYDLSLEDCWGAAADLVLQTDIVADLVRVNNCGEGFQINGYTRALVTRFTYRNSNSVSVGDSLELVNGQDLRLENFSITGTFGGSALDLTGRNITILNGLISDGTTGVVMQPDAANPLSPNSNNFSISNVVVKNMVDQAFVVTGGSNGEFRGSVNDCRAEDCQTGFLITNATGTSKIEINDCVATKCTTAGISILNCGTVTVRGGVYDEQATGAPGIFIANRVGAGVTKVDIEGARACGNDRFGVYIEDNTNYPIGRVSVYADGNSIGDMSYFDGLDGRTYAGKDLYLFNSTKTGLELVNTKLTETSPVYTTTRVVTGLTRIQWGNLKLRQLQGGSYKQRLEIYFAVVCTVEQLATTAGNNVELNTDADYASTFAVGDSLVLQWNATTEVWDEVSRNQSYQLPFQPNLVTGFRSWYKSDTGLWQNTGKTVAAASGDPVRSWAVAQGTGPDLVAPSDAARPTRTSLGGIVGNGSSQHLLASGVNLSGPYTIVFRHATPDAYFVLNRFFSLDASTQNWQLYSGDSVLATSAFNKNVIDGTQYVLGTRYSQDVVVGVAVAGDGTTTGYKQDGTTFSMGSTARSASSTIYALSYLGINFTGNKALRDIIVFDSILSQSDFEQLQAYLL